MITVWLLWCVTSFFWCHFKTASNGVHVRFRHEQLAVFNQTLALTLHIMIHKYDYQCSMKHWLTWKHDR